jgi:hypothetical protein
MECYNLPIERRNWFANKLQEQLTKEEEAYKKASQKK